MVDLNDLISSVRNPDELVGRHVVIRVPSCRRHYHFVERSGDRYYWEARVPGDSRVEEISCPVDWFWSWNS